MSSLQEETFRCHFPFPCTSQKLPSSLQSSYFSGHWKRKCARWKGGGTNNRRLKRDPATWACWTLAPGKGVGHYPNTSQAHGGSLKEQVTEAKLLFTWLTTISAFTLLSKSLFKCSSKLCVLSWIEFWSFFNSVSKDWKESHSEVRA